MNERDDFPVSVKELLAKRVGGQCSRLGCGRMTSGPQSDPKRYVNIGVAAHVTAARPGGPRYDPSLTSDQRRSEMNGIWLCQNHAKLVDNDVGRFTTDELRHWKALAEDRALRNVDGAEPLRVVPIFERLEGLISGLLAEMRVDLASEPLVRECILMQKQAVYNGSEEDSVFAYYFDDHQDLQNAFRILENYGLVADVTDTNLKRYRVSEDLVDYLTSGRELGKGPDGGDLPT